MTDNGSFDPATGAWNNSLGGDFLWSRNNFGEGRPDVMAPFTFSVTDKVWRKISLLPGYSMAGNLCGRFYANVSVSMSMLKALGKSRDATRLHTGDRVRVDGGQGIVEILAAWR